LSVPDEGYTRNVPDEGYTRNVPDEGYTRNVPDEGYYRNVPDEGYTRNASCSLNSISTFLSIRICERLTKRIKKNKKNKHGY
jgi:hypothetical protein